MIEQSEKYWEAADKMGLTEHLHRFVKPNTDRGNQEIFALRFLAVLCLQENDQPFMWEIGRANNWTFDQQTNNGICNPYYTITHPAEKEILQKLAGERGWSGDMPDLCVYHYTHNQHLNLLSLVKCKIIPSGPLAIYEQLDSFSDFIEFLQENEGSTGKEIFSSLTSLPITQFSARDIGIDYVYLRGEYRRNRTFDNMTVRFLQVPLNRNQIFEGIRERRNKTCIKET